MRDATVKRVSALHRLALRATGGRLGRTLPGVGAPMLLLTTTGRRSGRARTVPLLYLDVEGGYAVIASFGGRPYHPDWYHNLLARPEATVQVGGATHQVEATVTEGDQRHALWERAVAAYPGYAGYQSRTDRQIPVVLLRRS